MTATPTMGPRDEEGSPYVGWVASLLLVGLVFVIGAGLWIRYHGW